MRPIRVVGRDRRGRIEFGLKLKTNNTAPRSNRNPDFTVGSLEHSLWIHQISMDRFKYTTREKLSTIMPLGVHELYLIDSTERAGGIRRQAFSGCRDGT